MRSIARRRAAAGCALVLGGVVPPTANAAAIIELNGRGVQIYTCSGVGHAFAWTLKAPEATLSDMLGRPSGRHFAGPSWQANDGSVVSGVVVASGSLDADTIPWLLLRAKSHAGQGVFASVGYILRSHTVGGAAPSAGCDALHSGAESRIGYSADYVFFPGPQASPP